MDQTSHSAAIAVQLAGFLGLAGLITMPLLALRQTRDAVCPQRARREALAAQRRAEEFSAPGSPAAIGAQRTVQWHTVPA